MNILDNVNNYKAPEEEVVDQQKEQAEQTTSDAASSPMDSTVGGGTPQQAAMMGTPAQQQGMAAQLESNKEDTGAQARDAGLTSREDYLEQTSPQQRIDAQAAEQAKQATANLQGLGSFSTQIEQLVKQNLSNRMGEGLVPTEFEISDEELTNIAAEGQGEVVKKAFNEVQALVDNGATQQEVIERLKNVPKEAWGQGGIYDAMKRIYQNDQGAMSSAVADAIAGGAIDPSELTASAVIDSGLMNKDENGVYTELGLTEGQVVDILGEGWKDMNLDQIEAQVENFQAKNKTGPEKMQEMLADPTIPASVKQQLQAELASMGASGELVSAQEADQAADVIQAADQVRVGEELVSTNELLDDENITNDVNNLLSDLANADKEGMDTQEILEQFAATYGEDAAQWASEEFNNLKASGANLDNVIEEVSKTQQKNQDILEGKGLGLGAEFEASGDKLMKALGFQQEGPFGQAIDPQSSEEFKMISDLKNMDEATYDSFMGVIAGLDEEALMGLGEITANAATPEEKQAAFNQIVQKLTTADGKEQLTKLSQMDEILGPLQNNPNTSMQDIMQVFPPDSMFTKIATPEGLAQQTKRLEMLAKVDPSFQKILEEFKDVTKSGDPREIAQGLMQKIGGEEGINISNLMESDGLWATLNRSDQDIDRQINDRRNAKQQEINGVKQGIQKAQNDMSNIESKTPWMKGGKPDSSKAYANHPSRNKWKKAFDPGPLGPGTAQKQGARIFTALTNNPDLFKSMPPYVPGQKPSKDLINWVSKNIGLDPYKQNKDTGSSQVRNMLNNLLVAGGGTRGTFGIEGGDISKGIANLFGADVKKSTATMGEYGKASKASKAKVPTNEWDGV